MASQDGSSATPLLRQQVFRDQVRAGGPKPVRWREEWVVMANAHSGVPPRTRPGHQVPTPVGRGLQEGAHYADCRRRTEASLRRRSSGGRSSSLGVLQRQPCGASTADILQCWRLTGFGSLEAHQRKDKRSMRATTRRAVRAHPPPEVHGQVRRGGPNPRRVGYEHPTL